MGAGTREEGGGAALRNIVQFECGGKIHDVDSATFSFMMDIVARHRYVRYRTDGVTYRHAYVQGWRTNKGGV